MQFYRDGYRPGDPEILPGPTTAVADLVDVGEVDVLIVGTGPAGTVLGAQLAAFPDIRTRVVERREGPLEVGQADGVACRTVEMFQAFGLAEVLLREAYWVNEVRFWGPSAQERDVIERTGWTSDTPDGLSEFPHVIVNQARMQQFLLEHMAKSATRLQPDYGVEFVALTIDEGEFPVRATLRRGDDTFTVRAKYVVGCDGARSGVRRAIGRELVGDAANHAWGVMDVLATTDFPDWRTKNVVQSAGKGSLLMIPREGGSMVRLYVDLGPVPLGDRGVRSTTVEQLTVVANAILHPYSIDVRSVAWSSVYEVGQRVAASFDDVPTDDTTGRTPRVFIAGDACHTHSAKAGQGMNVSMQDAFNLGWKLASVLQGRSDATLLRSYSAERQPVAQDLIDFDRHWSDFIAQPILDPAHPELGGIAPEQMRDEFARQGRYTAGVATRYPASALIGSGAHQHLAEGFPVGMRFQAVPATRVADGRALHLGHTHRADGRWRLYLFEDRDRVAFDALATWLSDAEGSPLQRFRSPGGDVDEVLDVLGVLRADHHDVSLLQLPGILLPRTGPLGLQDWEKVWSRDPREDLFAVRGIADAGAMVLVRPDQYVAQVLPLTARGELTELLAGVLIDQSGSGRPVGASAR